MPDIGESSRKALRQLLGNKNKPPRNADAQTQYAEFFQEMIETGHLEPVPESYHNSPPEKHFVMPHHAVWKPSSTTTKCRGVFNASAKTTNGRSLNECLRVGPKQQPALFEILIQFRLNRIALSGDITKMYRQIELNEKDRNFQQMFWRSSQKQPIKKYRMTRVIYGVSSTSYHAIRALSDTAKDAPSIHCKNSLLKSFYVDDLLGGVDTPEQVIGLLRDITTTLELIGMSIRKWASNSHEVMEAISPELQENNDLFIGEHDHTIKALGLNWRPKTDNFYFNRPQSQCSVVTHEETVIECPSVELDEFQKSDFPQLVVKLDCKKLKKIISTDSDASNHATPNVCPINSMQFLTGFNQEKHQKSLKKAKTVKTDVDKNLQKTPIGDIRDVVPDTDSCPKSSELSEPENNYSNTENPKSEKQK